MLRDFQAAMQSESFQAWGEGAINIMPVLATGGGKTVLIGDTIIKIDEPTAVIAHRQELLTQLALALNREHVPHAIIAPKETIDIIIAVEMETHEYTCYKPGAPVRVAGVDTLIRRDPAFDRWFKNVKLVVIDEGHHVLRDNKWGRALLQFPNAWGFFPTAHALRGDRKGLGRDAQLADGYVDRLVVGPCGRDLIRRGFLTDWRPVFTPSHLKLEHIKVGASGEFNQKELARAVHEDDAIVGDVVSSYVRFAGGKLGITFAVDLDSAAELVRAYREKGIPAEVITGETHPKVRSNLMKRFRNREILQMVSVDVLGEGVDVPAVEVVSMARPTASFQLYAQQFGRALRPMIFKEQMDAFNSTDDPGRLAMIAASRKPKAIIIDHVGNWARFFHDHGFVDSRQTYRLTRSKKQPMEKEHDPDFIPQRSCLFCFLPYEVVLPACPHCGEKFVPQGRSKPAQVDGDLFELSSEIRDAMYAEVERMDAAPFVGNAVGVIANSIIKNHRDKQLAQATLREIMLTWGGWQENHLGRPRAEAYRRFFHKFGVDVLTAQTLAPVEASQLESKIRADLSANNIVRLTA